MVARTKKNDDLPEGDLGVYAELHRVALECSREGLAEVVWKVDGPTYGSWPCIGERVDALYKRQYPGEWNRCLRIADAVLEALRPRKSL